MSKHLGLFSFCGFLFFSSLTQAQSRYRVVDLGTLGGESSRATAINNAGQVAGYSKNSRQHNHAFLFEKGLMTDLGSVEGNESFACGLNENAQVVGRSFMDRTNDPDYPDGADVAFLYQNEEMQDLGLGIESVAFGINDSGTIVGVANGNSFVLQDGVVDYISTFGGHFGRALAINDRGNIVGEAQTSDGSFHAFLLAMPDPDPQDIHNLLLPNPELFRHSRAVDINDNLSFGQPQILLEAETESEEQKVFFYEGLDTWELPSLGGAITRAGKMNERGQVVGSSQKANGKFAAFFWENGLMVDLNNKIEQSSGWKLVAANDINDRGEIVGHGFHNGQDRAFLLSPVSLQPVKGRK